MKSKLTGAASASAKTLKLTVATVPVPVKPGPPGVTIPEREIFPSSVSTELPIYISKIVPS